MPAPFLPWTTGENVFAEPVGEVRRKDAENFIDKIIEDIFRVRFLADAEISQKWQLCKGLEKVVFGSIIRLN